MLGPTLGALRPGAGRSGRRWCRRARFVTETTPTIKNQIRPFTRAAQPAVKALRPAARDLADVTPS